MGNLDEILKINSVSKKTILDHSGKKITIITYQLMTTKGILEVTTNNIGKIINDPTHFFDKNTFIEPLRDSNGVINSYNIGPKEQRFHGKKLEPRKKLPLSLKLKYKALIEAIENNKKKILIGGVAVLAAVSIGIASNIINTKKQNDIDQIGSSQSSRYTSVDQDLMTETSDFNKEISDLQESFSENSNSITNQELIEYVQKYHDLAREVISTKTANALNQNEEFANHPVDPESIVVLEPSELEPSNRIGIYRRRYPGSGIVATSVADNLPSPLEEVTDNYIMAINILKGTSDLKRKDLIKKLPEYANNLKELANFELIYYNHGIETYDLSKNTLYYTDNTKTNDDRGESR